MVPNNGLAERQNKIKLTNVVSRQLINAFESEPVFQLAAKGINLSFQWQIKTGDTWKDLPACIFPYLNFSEIPTSLDQSIYRCKVYNEAGTVYSDEVTLTVNKPTTAPVIELQPSDANVDPVTPSVALDDVYANVVINAGSGGGGGGGEATTFIGISSTKITDGGNELPTIDGTEVTPETGNIVIYKETEFIYANTKWYKFGDAGVYLLSGAEAVEDKDIADEAISQKKINGLTEKLTNLTTGITEANTKISNVALTATDAKVAATEAKESVVELSTKVTTVETAANEASEKATTASDTADKAKEAVDAATAKAESAETTAEEAKETAETALTNVTTAKTTAESALTKANTNASAITDINTELAKKANTATTLEGYGITDAYTSDEVNAELEKKADSATVATELAKKADKATTLADYGITDAYTSTEVDTELAKKADSSTVTAELAKKATIEALTTGLATKVDTTTFNTELAKKANSATTLSGYGITDAYTSDEVDTKLAIKADSSTVTTELAKKADSATTLSGYGITDAYTSDEVDTELAKKATTEALTTGLATKVDTATFDTEIEAIKNKVYTKSYVNDADITSTTMEDTKYVFEIPFTHSFNTKDLSVNVYYNDARIITDVVLTDMNTVTIRMLVADNIIAANTLRIVVQR